MFRTDASLEIGTGHVMRCLALSDELVRRGAECQFICREHTGNLISHIRGLGYNVHALPMRADIPGESLQGSGDFASVPGHSDWLGATQDEDIADCHSILENYAFDLLVVDHYALDGRWETALRRKCKQLMAIDDLADRLHACDVLLDQTLGRSPADYTGIVPTSCVLLCGSDYALLRPEFAASRAESIRFRRRRSRLEQLVVMMGGVDQHNVTRDVLQAVRLSALPGNCRITVVMGVSAPWLADIVELAALMPIPTEVKVNVRDVAELLERSDLVIGAAGGSAWERCCLGIPAISLVTAENQRGIAQALKESGAAEVVESVAEEIPQMLGRLATNPHLLEKMSVSAAKLVDGLGAVRVASCLGTLFES